MKSEQGRPITSGSSALVKTPQSASSMSKERKRQAIRDLLKQRLGIGNIYDIEIGEKLTFKSLACSPPKGQTGLHFDVSQRDS